MIHRELWAPLAALLPLLALSGCVGSTGGDLFTFSASAAGPADAIAGQPLEFTTGRGYHVALTKAKIHVGALYLNRALPVSGSQTTECILPGIYVAEVTQGLSVDALSPEPAPFPASGDAIAERALAGEVWLSGGDVNSLTDTTVILEAAGTAEKEGEVYPFEASITIAQNRQPPSSDPSQPGAHPICKERIVSPIPVDLTPRAGGALLLRIDPRGWFVNVDFAGLDQASDDPPLFRFRDESSGQPNLSLYDGIRARHGVYTFTWTE